MDLSASSSETEDKVHEPVLGFARILIASHVLRMSPSKSSTWRLPLNLALAVSRASLLSSAIFILRFSS